MCWLTTDNKANSSMILSMVSPFVESMSNKMTAQYFQLPGVCWNTLDEGIQTIVCTKTTIL